MKLIAKSYSNYRTIKKRKYVGKVIRVENLLIGGYRFCLQLQNGENVISSGFLETGQLFCPEDEGKIVAVTVEEKGVKNGA